MRIIPGLAGWLPRVCSKLAKERGRYVFVIGVILAGLGSDQIVNNTYVAVVFAVTTAYVLTMYPKGSGGP